MSLNTFMSTKKMGTVDNNEKLYLINYLSIVLNGRIGFLKRQ